MGRENSSQDGSHLQNLPKVTLRPSWVHAIAKTASKPRETESNLQAWNSDQNSPGSRTWPKEEYEQSIDLTVDGIPNNETYKDEQYMQRIKEQVRKLVTTKEIVKDDSLEDNILSEKAVKEIHEAGNCDLHAVQRRTNKVQCQRCYSYLEVGLQMCPCDGKVEFVGRNAFWHKTKNQATHCRCLHDIQRDARSQAYGAQP